MVWVYADFLITSLTFAALGLTLSDVIAETEQVGAAARTTAVLVGTLLAVRVAWIFPGAWAARHAQAHRQTWRRATVASWAGSRGVVTVATALALPTSIAGGEEFPDRNQVITVSLACVLVTLVVQGLTLVPLVSLLGVAEEADDEHHVAELRRAVCILGARHGAREHQGCTPRRPARRDFAPAPRPSCRDRVRADRRRQSPSFPSSPRWGVVTRPRHSPRGLHPSRPLHRRPADAEDPPRHASEPWRISANRCSRTDPRLLR